MNTKSKSRVCQLTKALILPHVDVLYKITKHNEKTPISDSLLKALLRHATTF